MGNPHPTKSKPLKIGRKHTGAPSNRLSGKRKRAKLVANQIKLGKYQLFKKKVAAYWRGELESYPENPLFKQKHNEQPNYYVEWYPVFERPVSQRTP